MLRDTKRKEKGDRYWGQKKKKNGGIVGEEREKHGEQWKTGNMTGRQSKGRDGGGESGRDAKGSNKTESRQPL